MLTSLKRSTTCLWARPHGPAQSRTPQRRVIARYGSRTVCFVKQADRAAARLRTDLRCRVAAPIVHDHRRCGCHHLLSDRRLCRTTCGARALVAVAPLVCDTQPPGERCTRGRRIERFGGPGARHRRQDAVIRVGGALSAGAQHRVVVKIFSRLINDR